MASEVEAGASSCWSSSRFVSISRVIIAMQVMFPPGRLRFVTRPSSIGSAPRLKTMGMVDVAAFAATVAGAPPIGTITAKRRLTKTAANVLAVGPAVFHRHILVLDITDFLQALVDRSNIPRVR